MSLLSKCLLDYYILIFSYQFNTLEHIKCIYLNNQQCTTQPILINLDPNEYTEGLRCYSLTVNLDKCIGSCNTLNDLPTRICVPNKMEDLNLSVFNMITGINDLKILTKHVSCKGKCKFHHSKYNSNQNSTRLMLKWV